MDRLEPLERQIAELKERMAAVESAVENLSSHTRHPVEKLLWQLGFPVLAQGGQTQLDLPARYFHVLARTLLSNHEALLVQAFCPGPYPNA